MVLGKSVESLLVAALGNQPSRGFGHQCNSAKDTLIYHFI